MYAVRRVALAAPRQAPRQIYQPIVRCCHYTSSNGTASSSTKAQTKSEPPKPSSSKSPNGNGTDSTKPAAEPYEPSTIAYGPNHHASRADWDIDWANSFHGISTCPVTKEQFDSLMRPLTEAEIEVKPDGIIYLPEIKYRRRLNEAFGPMGWGLIPKGPAEVGQNIVTREYALIVGGRFVSQAQGENSYFSPEQLPSSVEGCKSNALMRCCKDLGIASELWDPEFIRKYRKTSMQEVWVEHATTKKKRIMWFKKGTPHIAYPWKRSTSTSNASG